MALVLPSSIMHSGIQNRKQRNAIGPNVIKHQQIVVVVAYMYIPICIPFPPTVLPFPNLKILLRDFLINHQNSETAYVMKRNKKKKKITQFLKKSKYFKSLIATLIYQLIGRFHWNVKIQVSSSLRYTFDKKVYLSYSIEEERERERENPSFNLKIFHRLFDSPRVPARE